jgi:hypothetical protein
MMRRPPFKFSAGRLVREIESHSLPLDHLDFEDVGYGLVQAPQA